jgi:hypothetical protein
VKENGVSVEDDSSISEINILPDGRVCLFGVSQQVLEMLDSISLGDPALRNRIDSLRTGEMCPAIDLNEICAEQDDGAVNNRVRL